MAMMTIMYESRTNHLDYINQRFFSLVALMVMKPLELWECTGLPIGSCVWHLPMNQATNIQKTGYDGLSIIEKSTSRYHIIPMDLIMTNDTIPMVGI